VGVNTCEICGQDFASPAALGSHMRTHNRGKAKVSKANGETVVRVVVEQAPGANQSPAAICPDCGGQLELMPNGPGLYVLKCRKCYDGS
jgi:hypothetical protein